MRPQPQQGPFALGAGERRQADRAAGHEQPAGRGAQQRQHASKLAPLVGRQRRQQSACALDDDGAVGRGRDHGVDDRSEGVRSRAVVHVVGLPLAREANPGERSEVAAGGSYDDIRAQLGCSGPYGE
jgi:hypothetical protein